MKLRAFIILGVLALSGCAMVPDEISVPDNESLVSYSQAVTGGDGVKGKTARWGGIIVAVENKPQKTFVEVVNFPLNHYGKPKSSSEETIGRFKVEIDGFLDPIIFEKGRLVTFIGSVQTPLAGMIGEQPYMYPSIKVKDYYLWRKDNTYDGFPPMFFDYRMGWYSAWHPYYRPYLWSYHQQYRVVRSRNNNRNNYRPSRDINQGQPKQPRSVPASRTNKNNLRAKER